MCENRFMSRDRMTESLYFLYHTLSTKNKICKRLKDLYSKKKIYEYDIYRTSCRETESS